MGFTKDRLKNDFIALFGEGENQIHAYFAPGRINLLGEHTDYNGGYVLPASIQYGTLLLLRVSKSSIWRFRSDNMQFIADVTVTDMPKRVGKTWVNYPIGVMAEFTKRGVSFPGIDFLFSGNIPNGAGLSSSASIEMVTALALNEIFDTGIDRIDLIKMSQHAENDFVGMKCGIMDQFAVGMGLKNKALFLDCDTLDYDLVPVNLGDYRIMISNTNVRRELAGSEYNIRRAQCEKVVDILKNKIDIKTLSDLSVDQWEMLKNEVSDTVLRKRANHVIMENQRVQDAVKSLRANDLTKFGQFMLASHHSLRIDYEVSCRELDALVDSAIKTEGVLGSRMTGAGFGGCTISLVHKDQCETFKENVGKKYAEATGLRADFYLAEISDGAKKMNLF